MRRVPSWLSLGETHVSPLSSACWWERAEIAVKVTETDGLILDAKPGSQLSWFSVHEYSVSKSNRS